MTAEDTTPSEREAPQRFAWWHPQSADLGRRAEARRQHARRNDLSRGRGGGDGSARGGGAGAEEEARAAAEGARARARAEDARGRRAGRRRAVKRRASWL